MSKEFQNPIGPNSAEEKNDLLISELDRESSFPQNNPKEFLQNTDNPPLESFDVGHKIEKVNSENESKFVSRYELLLKNSSQDRLSQNSTNDFQNIRLENNPMLQNGLKKDPSNASAQEMQYQDLFSPENLKLDQELDSEDQHKDRNPLKGENRDTVIVHDSPPKNNPKYIQLKFYQRGVERAEEKKQREKNIEEDIKKLANSKKMTEGSYKLMISKIQNILTAIIMEVDKENTKKLSFEQFGRILTLLEILRIVQYDDTFNLQNEEQFLNNDPKDQNRRFEEMVMHEQLWNIFADNEETETVEAEFIFTVMRILLDPANLQSDETANILKNYINQYKPDVHEHKHRMHNRSGDGIDEPWSLPVLVKKFRKLNENRLAYNKTGYLKQDKAHEVEERNRGYTFKPEISEISAAIEQYHRQKFWEEHPDNTEHPNEGFSSYKNPIDGDKMYGGNNSSSTGALKPRGIKSSYNSNNNSTTHKNGSISKAQRELELEDRIKLLYKKTELTEKWREEQRQAKKDDELKGCTFQPNIKYHKSQDRDPDFFHRLHKADKNYKEREEQRIIEQIEREQEEEDHCTFRPEINQKSSLTSPKSVPLGYGKTIQRMRNAVEENKKKKELIDKVPCGENYDKIRKADIKPFSFVTKAKEPKKTPYMYIDANIGGGKTGRIGIHEGDDPKILAKNFAITFQLTPDLQKSLEEMITKQIADFNKTKAK